MHVFSKLSLTGNKNRDTEPLSNNICDNPACDYHGGLQSPKGPHNCTGQFPASSTPAEGSISVFRLFRSASAPAHLRDLGGGAWDSDKGEGEGSYEDTNEDYISKTRPCTGTYYVDAGQAHLFDHMMCDVHGAHCRRLESSRKAALEARERALMVEEEVKRDFEREYAMRQKNEGKAAELIKEESTTEREVEKPMKEQAVAEEVVAQQQQQSPRLLKRETRRLPVITRTAIIPPAADAVSKNEDELTADANDANASCTAAAGATAEEDSSNNDSSCQSPSVLFESVPRRHSDCGPPPPRPIGLIYDPRAKEFTKPPWINRSPDRPTSAPGFSFSHYKKRDRSTHGIGISTTNRTTTGEDEECVSYKSDLMITHFRTLMPAKSIQSLKAQSNSITTSGGKRYLISEPRVANLVQFYYGPGPSSAGGRNGCAPPLAPRRKRRVY